MAKRKRKGKKRRAAASDVIGGVALANLLSDTLGKLLRDFAVGAIRDVIDAVRHHDGGTKKPKRDIAADIMRILADRGPMPVADVVAAADAGVTPVLQALHVMIGLRLVALDAEGPMLQLTDSGAQTAGAVGAGGTTQ